MVCFILGILRQARVLVLGFVINPYAFWSSRRLLYKVLRPLQSVKVSGDGMVSVSVRS